MNLEEIAEQLSVAVRNTSGDERKMYDCLVKYLMTHDARYQSKAKKYYRRLDHYAQRRAEYVVTSLSGYAA